MGLWIRIRIGRGRCVSRGLILMVVVLVLVIVLLVRRRVVGGLMLCCSMCRCVLRVLGVFRRR